MKVIVTFKTPNAAILGIQKDSCAAAINKLCATGKVERVTPGSYIIR